MINKIINLLKSDKGADIIIDIFERQNIELFFVGGCVRNAILGIEIGDFDIAIKCEPDKTIQELKKNNIFYEDYAKRYGLIVAIIDGKKYEITSLREDYNQKGRSTDVKFTSDLKKDAQRRDFTINAIYLSSQGNIIDYFGGCEDLENHIVRFIGNAEKRIKEDYIRIFRFNRFLGCFENVNIIDDYVPVIEKNIPEIKNYLSNDIMRNEINKMLKNKYKMNSLLDYKNPTKKNVLIKKVNEWWIQDNYNLGIDTCISKINHFFQNNINCR